MLIDRIKKLANETFEEVVEIRRHLHAHPELSFEEHETAAFVQQKLREANIEFQSGVAGTGVVALIRGRNPESKTVALRADMDALPIQEENDHAYRSRRPGVMHACGHDAHTAGLIGACRILQDLRGEFDGTVKFIFQPGEERTPGGASIMIREGVLENPRPSGIIGQHVYPLLPAGAVGFRPGMMMASCDEIDIWVKGRGGHGAIPQSTVDPVAIAAQLIVGLQQLVSRMADPTVPSVLSFGRIQSQGGTYNVIPSEVHLQGTFRTFNEQWRYQAHERIREVAAGIARSYGADCEVIITVGYPFLVNDENLTERCRAAAVAYLGADQVHDLPLRLTAEDFAYYTHHTAGCFYRLGTGNVARGIQSPVHTPTFDIDEEALRTGAGLLAWLAIEELNGRDF